MSDLLDSLWKPIEGMTLMQRLITASVVIAVALLIELFFRKVVVKVIKKMVAHTATKWDDYLLNDRVLDSMGRLVCPILLLAALPMVVSPYPLIRLYIHKALVIYVTVMVARLICAFISGFYEASSEQDHMQHHPLEGLAQMLKLIVICVAVIIGVSVLIERDPAVILAGIGASAAVLMLVFKDTLLGLAAGVQLSVNDMLRVGDWISIPSRQVNGVVTAVTLTTVKVKNFDNTIVTVPPYSMISESFQNWRGMWDSGARRVMRAVNIDMNTVVFAEPEQIDSLVNRGFIEPTTPRVRTVNLQLFRAYLERYLSDHNSVDTDALLMIRQLDPTPQGLPLQLYFFTTTTKWEEYEAIQSDVFDHVIATAGEFGLKIFQVPTGLDLISLSR